MFKKISYILLGMTLMVSGTVLAAPYFTYQRTLLPETNNAFDLGTTTSVWRDLFVTQICLSGSCRTSWPSGGGGASDPNVTYATLSGTRYYQASSTATDNLSWRFNNGFLSNASSTISSALRLSSLSQGFLYTGSTGLVQPIASSSIKLSWFNNDAGFITSAASTTLLSDTNSWTGGNTFANATATNLGATNFYANNSAGMNLHANNGTDIAILGAGNTANVTFYGGVNIDGATRLATSLTGLLKASSGVVSTASNGTDYTLITALSCSAGQHFSQVTAGGVFTCSADTGGGGGGAGGTFSTSTISGYTGVLNNYANNATDVVEIGGTAGTSTAKVYFDPNGTQFYQIGNASTASTTIMGSTYHPTVGQGIAYLGTNGKLLTVATSTFSLSQFTNDLASLTALDTSLTFSGSYNGSVARTVGLNTGRTNTWTVLQNFNYASATAYFSSQVASTTDLFVGTGQGALYAGSGQAVKAVATSTPTIGASLSYSGTIGQLLGGVSGTLSLNMANANTWTALQTFSNTTTTLASFTYASTTALRIGLADGCLNITGGLVGTTGSACGSGGGSAYPFPLTGNATSTLTQFNGGLTAFASSTIGNGTQAGGLTISGGATTTGQAYFANNVGIGTSNPSASLDISYPSGQNALAILQTADSIGNAVWQYRNAAIYNMYTGLKGSNGSFFIDTNASGASGHALTIDQLGNTGIGSSSPYSILSINNTAGVDAFAIGSSTGTSFLIDKAGSIIVPQKSSRTSDLNIFFGSKASNQTGIGSTNNDLYFYSWGGASMYINNNYVGLDSGIVLNWGGSAADSGKDIGISRLSSGRLAIGNGTAGSIAGSVSMAYSSTTGASFDYASSTTYFGAGLASCNGASNALTWSAGVFGCNTITGGGSGNMSGWATTTISGQLLLYPVNSQTTDVAFGSSATTTAPFWWDVSATSTYIGNGGVGTSSMSFAGGTGTDRFWNIGAYSTSQSGFGNFYIASSSSDSDMVTNQFFTVEQGGDVGIGSSTPFGLFSINGTSAIGSAPLFVIGSSTGTDLIVTNKGWFGYGTSSPDSQFTIQGDSSSNDVFDIDLSNGNHALQFMSNGKAGFGTSTPWAQLSVQALSTYDNKLPFFNFSTSSTPFGQLLSLFSTTTTMRGSVTGGDSGARLLFGQASSTIPTLDQLSGDFRTNSDWGTMGCDTIGSGLLAQLTANANGMTCPGLSFFEDAAAVADYTADVGGGSAYLRLRAGATGVTAAAGDGFVIKPLTATWSFATNTPIMEITGRIVPANASSTLFIVGFTNYTGTTANVETLPTNGCFVIASSTKANWQLISNNGGGANITQTDTGVASTSNPTGVGIPSFQKIRVEADSNRCTAWITVRGGVATKTEITTNISTSIALTPSVSAGNFTTAGLTKEFHLRSIRIWFKGLNNL